MKDKKFNRYLAIGLAVNLICLLLEHSISNSLACILSGSSFVLIFIGLIAYHGNLAVLKNKKNKLFHR